MARVDAEECNIISESKPCFNFGGVHRTLCIGHELEKHGRRECTCFQLCSQPDHPQLDDNQVIYGLMFYILLLQISTMITDARIIT